ncbi:MAG: hypothetical protein ACRDFS_03220, partial [Chloroflexota bacterium]
PFSMNPKPGSPAIAGGDAVTCEALAGPGTTGTDRDELGDARNSAIRGGCDMGAYDGGAGGQIALTVNGASLTEPGSFSGTVATFTDHEATPQDKSDYTATINWGDATAPTSGVVGAPVNGVYSVTGSHTYADDMSGGYPVTVTLTDTDGVGTVATNSITVSDASLTSIGPVSKSFVEGTSKNVNLGSFRDPGSTDCTGGDYLATLYWDGNAKQEAGTASLTKTSSSTCTFSVSATGTFAEEGTVTPFLQVCESDNSSNCVTISDGTINGDVITVTDPALTEVAVGGTVASQEGSSATYTVGSFTDPVGSGDSCGSGYTATIHWNGNGIGDPAGAVSTPTGSGPCTYTVTGSYTYADEGTYAPSVTVCEADNNSNCLVDISGDAAHVTDAALSASGATAGCAIFAGCDVTVATFTDTNNSCNQEGETLATQYSATLTRADGTTGTGLITEDPAGSCDFTVTDSHVYTDKVGPHTVGVSIADDGGATAIVSATVNVGFPPTSTKNGNVLDNTSTTCVKGTTLRLVAHYVRAGYDSGSLTYRYGTTVISGLKVNSIVVTGTKPANNGNTAVIVGTALQNNRPVAIEIDVSDTSRGVCNYDKTEIKTSMGYDSGPFLSSASVYL